MEKIVQNLKKEPGIPNGEPPENHIDLPLKKNVVCFFDAAQEHVSAAEKQTHVSGEFWRERKTIRMVPWCIHQQMETFLGKNPW